MRDTEFLEELTILKLIEGIVITAGIVGLLCIIAMYLACVLHYRFPGRDEEK